MSSKINSANSSSSAANVLFAGLGVLVLTVAAVAWWWNGRVYPDVSSAENLHLMRALYTACSSRNAERLSKVELRVESAKKEGSMSDGEYLAFNSIIGQARNEDWESAIDESYQFAKDQTR